MSAERLRTLKALVIREKRWLEESGDAHVAEADRHDYINALEFGVFLMEQDKRLNPSCYVPDAAAVTPRTSP